MNLLYNLTVILFLYIAEVTNDEDDFEKSLRNYFYMLAPMTYYMMGFFSCFPENRENIQKNDSWNLFLTQIFKNTNFQGWIILLMIIQFKTYKYTFDMVCECVFVCVYVMFER